MSFVFETRRHKGSSGPSVEPDYPAVKVSSYIDKTKSSHMIRFRFTFNAKLVSSSRWIKDDRIEVGGDPENLMLAFKRSATGYRIVGKGFTDNAKDRPSVQVSVDQKSPVSIISSLCLDRWIPLHESGVLFVTPSISDFIAK